MAYNDNGVVSDNELKKAELLNKIKFNNLSSEQIDTLLKMTNKFLIEMKADKEKRRGYSYFG